MTERMRKILIISYHFPPDAEVGGIRPAKFVKYLPEFGWVPYVLTIKEKYIRTGDYERLKDLENARVFRTSVWPNFLQILMGLRDWCTGKLGLRQQSNSKPSDNRRLPDGSQADRSFSFLRRVLDSVFELPDKNVGWAIPAVWKGYWLIKKEKIGVIFTTAPPSTVSLVGFILAKMTRAKLITDLRDPWWLHEGKPRSSRTQFSDAIERWLENRITRSSQKIIATTEQYREFLISRYPDMPKDRFCTIWNGFDSSDFEFDSEPVKEKDHFIISYLGTFYYGRTPREFLQAAGELMKEEAIPMDCLEINFIGQTRYAEGISVEELIKKNELDGCAILSDKVSYKESLVQMKRANVLLLFAPEQYYAIPGKAYEYLCTTKQILCFAKEGATADLIRRTGSGLVVDPSDVGQIKKAIQELYLSWKLKTNRTCKFDIRCFERRELTKQLSSLLSDVMSFEKD